MERHRKANAFPDIGTPGDPRLLAAIERRTPGIAGGGINHFFGGTVVTPPKKSRKSKVFKPACPFGEIITWAEGEAAKTGIRGGLLVCGDKNFNVPNQELTLSAAGKWLVQILLSGIDPATDDDDEIFLPGGVVTASGTPEWDNKVYSAGPPATSYDDTTNPSTPADTGDIVIPIGILTIAGGSASLVATGCGTITVNQCAGILSYSRG